jgi:predicted dehydrogenase
MRLGILSTARINRLVIPPAHESPEVELLGVASRSLERASAYAEQWRIPHPYGSYDELLTDPGIDAVYISLPNALHVDWSIRALDAGKHVLCEKPLSRRPDEVERAFDAAERADRILMEAFMYRHNPQTKRLQELVAGGEIGELQRIESSFGFTVDDEANVRLSAELDGGALMDVGCYCISASRLLAGEPQQAIGRQQRGGNGVDVHFEGELRFAGGVVATFECGLEMETVDTLRVTGTDGSIFLDDPWHAREPRLELETRTVELESVNSYRLELENLARVIRGEEEPLLGRADALGQARAIAALYASAEADGATQPL